MTRLLVILVLATLAGAAVLLLQYRQFQSTPIDIEGGAVHYTLEPGTSLGQLATDLQARGVLDSVLMFKLLARELDAATRLHAGEYTLTGDMTPRDLLQLITDGKVVQYSLTLIEGQDFRQMLARIQNHPQVLVTLRDTAPQHVMQAIDHDGEHPEGRFLADTYLFPNRTTDVDILRRAYSAMEKLLADAWQGRADDLPLATPYEALILASIIEKETGLAEERAAIAGVFVRRLQQGMRLQTDPTVIYGLGDSFDGNLRRRDLLNDTPYNSYTRAGLPPTPIAMPGRAAIEAALHPADGDTLYFVARGDGSHYFSATLEEHELAVDKFQRKRKGITLPGEHNP